MRVKNKILRIIMTALALFAVLACRESKKTAKTHDKKDLSAEKGDSLGTAFDFEKVKFKEPAHVQEKQYNGWKLASEPRYFGPDNLYDLINGGADIFVNYGFKKISTSDYKNNENPTVSITVEIYDMGSSLGAFGRFSRYLDNIENPEQTASNLPEELKSSSIMGEGDFLTWRDKYLVHLTLMEEDPEAQQDDIAQKSKEFLPPIALAIVDKIEGNSQLPKELSMFPGENIIQRSQGWSPSRLLGYEDLNSGFFARYKKNDSSWTLFLTDPLISAKEAQTIVSALKKQDDAPLELKAVGKQIIGIKAQDKPSDAKIMKAGLKALEAALPE